MPLWAGLLARRWPPPSHPIGQWPAGGQRCL